jgi:hypothetical protein
MKFNIVSPSLRASGLSQDPRTGNITVQNQRVIGIFCELARGWTGVTVPDAPSP